MQQRVGVKITLYQAFKRAQCMMAAAQRQVSVARRGESAANRFSADLLNTALIASPVLSYPLGNCEGFVPIPQIHSTASLAEAA